MVRTRKTYLVVLHRIVLHSIYTCSTDSVLQTSIDQTRTVTLLFYL